nr:hypothetical protein [Tanacetum cinerariifolium]
VNQVDARLQNFEIQFLKEASIFVGDFKPLANEADAFLAKHKALELEIKRLLKAVVSQDIMIIVQNESVVDTLDLQTELEHTQNPLSHKLENENVELEFQVLNYARENAHLKATYKNLFDSIFVSRAQTKTIIASLQNELQSTIYKNVKLRTQLFKKVSDQKDNTHDTSANTKFAKQPIMENLPKVGMFRINPLKTSSDEKHVPNTVRASDKKKPITVSQPLVITKKDVNSDLNGLSSTGVDNTKTRRPQPRSNTKHDRVASASKSSRSMNKEAEVEDYHRNLLLSKNNKHISSACNTIKIDSQDVISKVVCAMCKKCLISVNHDKCLRNYVNGKHSRNLQTELERTKEHFENCIIKKETEYAKHWNDWYKKCDECKYDKISYNKAYKDMQQKIEWLQAQLGDLKGKIKDTLCVSDTRNPLSQKLKNENVELEFQVLNYARENAHLKAIYKNLFDSIYVSRAQTKTIIASLQNELQSNIYKNAKLITQLFKKVSDQKNNTQDTSENTKFAKQPILERSQDTSENTKFAKQPIVENLSKISKTNALSKPVTSNLVSTPQESKGVNNDKVIAPGMFRINPDKTSRQATKVPNTVRASNRTKPITVSQPPIFARKDVNSNLNGLCSTGVDNTKTRRPQPKSNTKNDRVPS